MTAQARKSVITDLRSPFVGVPNSVWAKFLHALSISDDREDQGKPRRFNAISYSGGLGCFALLPKRLVEIGVFKEEVVIRKGKAFASPKDTRRLISFLSNPIEQRDAVQASLLRYAWTFLSLPEGMTKSGALALHHRLGPNALSKWVKHQEPSTAALFQRTNGLF